MYILPKSPLYMYRLVIVNLYSCATIDKSSFLNIAMLQKRLCCAYLRSTPYCFFENVFADMEVLYWYDYDHSKNYLCYVFIIHKSKGEMEG